MSKHAVNFRFQMGSRLRDKVTGLEGIVMVRAEYSSGCHHYAISPTQATKDNTSVPEYIWLDSSRLEQIGSEVMSFTVDPTRPSGDFPSGPSHL